MSSEVTQPDHPAVLVTRGHAPAGLDHEAGVGRVSANLRAAAALLARDLRVLRRDVPGFAIRSVTQPMLFVFVFSFVIPRLNGGSGGFGGQAGQTFATILVPGLLATAIMTQGVMAVTTPLVMELSYTREIEDRVLAPIPIWMVGASKIVSGAVQAFLAAALVLPCVLWIHAPGQQAHLALRNWPSAVGLTVLASLLMASFGLFLGTVVDPRKLSSLFTVVVVPVIMLGCVYYPWANLRSLPWMQVICLFNPLVYVSEALRASLAPGVEHLPAWAYLLALGGGTLVLGAISVRTLSRRLVD